MPSAADRIADAIAGHAAGVPGIGSPASELRRAVQPDGTPVFWQEFTGGAAVFHSAVPPGAGSPPLVSHVMADIYRRYRQLGGGDTARAVMWLGAPLGDTRPAPIGPDPAPPPPGVVCGSREAYVSDFGHGSIYWSEKTGPRLVRGKIAAEWRRLDGPHGPLGLPVEDPRAEATRVSYSDFERGTIWQTPDGAVHPICELRVDFVGFRRTGTVTGAADPVYFAVYSQPLVRTRERDIEQAVWATPLPLTGTAYGSGDGRPGCPRTTVFRGRPAPFEVTVLAWRHRDGDPYAFRNEIAVGVAAAGAAATYAVPAGGAIFLNQEGRATISSAVSRALDSGDDFVAQASWRIDTRAELLTLLRPAPTSGPDPANGANPATGPDPASGAGRRRELALWTADHGVCYRPSFAIAALVPGPAAS